MITCVCKRVHTNLWVYCMAVRQSIIFELNFSQSLYWHCVMEFFIMFICVHLMLL